MLARVMKGLVRRSVARLGYEIRRAEPPAPPPPDPPHGIGKMEEFLRFLHTRGIRPKCVLDVGAYRATWAVRAAKVFPDARFVLVEPQAELAPDLTAFLSGCVSGRLVEAGAAAAPGRMALSVGDGPAGLTALTVGDGLDASSFLPQPDEALIRAGRQRLVPVVTLDEVCAGEQHLPELVKLDVQGFELEALRGAGRLFGHTECFILEVSLFRSTPTTPDLHAVVEFMHGRGYQVYDVCGFMRRPLDGALGQIDLAFARTAGPLCRETHWSRAYGPAA
jgi:FkbM family methyltransferase